MARSSYIYTATRSGETVAAFTVKHELVSWLVRHRKQYPVGFYEQVTVTRFSDGGWSPKTQLGLQELLRGQ